VLRFNQYSSHYFLRFRPFFACCTMFRPISSAERHYLSIDQHRFRLINNSKKHALLSLRTLWRRFDWLGGCHFALVQWRHFGSVGHCFLGWITPIHFAPRCYSALETRLDCQLLRNIASLFCVRLSRLGPRIGESQRLRLFTRGIFGGVWNQTRKWVYKWT
jgi:hypothetical protein